MQEYIPSIAVSYLATLIALSGFRSYIMATVKPSDWNSAPLLLKISKNRSFCLLSVSVAVAMLLFDDIYISLVCTSFASTVIAIGMFLDNSGKCECFGGSNALSKRKILFIRIIALLAAGFIFLFFLKRDVTSVGLSWLRLSVGSALLLYFIAVLMGRQPTKSSILASKGIATPGLKTWKPKQFVGFDTGNAAVHLCELISHQKIIFLILVSENCSHCAALLPDIEKMAQVFRHSVEIVVIHQDPQKSIVDKSYRSLYDPAKNIYSAVKAEGSPCALLLNSTTLMQIAPVAYGSDKVRILFAVTLNLIERMNTNAT